MKRKIENSNTTSSSLIKKQKTHTESLLEKTCFQPGVSRHLFRFLPSKFWFSCRILSRTFETNICNSLEEMKIPFSFFAANCTIGFHKLYNLTLYGCSETESLYWNVSEQLYPSLSVLVVCKSDTDVNHKPNPGILLVSDKIHLKKLVLHDCHETLSNIFFNPMELSEISLKGALDKMFISSVFANLYNAIRLQCVYLEDVKWQCGCVQALAHIEHQETWKLQMKNISLNEYDFRNCKLTEFTCVDPIHSYSWDSYSLGSEHESNLSDNRKELNVSENPDLSIVHVKDLVINSFVLWTSFECLEYMTSLTLCLQATTLHSFLSCLTTEKNWLTRRLPHLKFLKLSCDNNSISRFAEELYIQNHNYLKEIHVIAPLKHIYVQNLIELEDLNISSVSNVVVSHASGLRRFHLASPSCDSNIYIDKIPALTEFLWDSDYDFHQISVSSLQLPWELLKNLALPIVLTEEKSTFLSPVFLGTLLQRCIMLNSLRLAPHQVTRNLPRNQIPADTLIKHCSQIRNLQSLDLLFFQDAQLYIVSGFSSLEVLKIKFSSIVEGIQIENLPSLKSCFISNAKNSKYNVSIKSLPQLQDLILDLEEVPHQSTNLTLIQLPKLNHLEIRQPILSCELKLVTDSSLSCNDQVLKYQQMIEREKAKTSNPWAPWLKRTHSSHSITIHRQ